MTSSAVEVWRSRHVLRYLVRRDIALKYQQSVMGYLWSLLEPIGIGLIYYFVFILVIGRGGLLAGVIPEDQYVLYLMSGVFSFMWTNGVLSESTGALVGQKHLITTMRVPREVFPLGRVISRSVEYFSGLPILVGIALLIDANVGWWMVSVLLGVLVQLTFLTGVALLLSSINVMMRDIERFMRMIHRLVFYSSPILYPLALVDTTDALPEWAKVIYMANPLVGIVELHHAAWFPQLFPSTGLLLTSATGAVVTLVAGWLVFRRLEPAVLKEL